MNWVLKKSISGILALTSLGFLTVFLFVWNNSNYQSEKNNLVNDIENQLALAYNDVKDEFLLDQFIPYMTKDMVEFDFFRDTLQFHDSLKIDVRTEATGGMRILTLRDDHEAGTEGELFFKFLNGFDSLNTSLRVEGIEIVENRDSLRERDTIFSFESDSHFSDCEFIDKDSTNSNFIQSLLSPIFSKDDLIFQRFDSYLTEKDLNIQYAIPSELNSPKGLLISHQTKGLGNRKISIDVFNYSRLLFQELLPSILFSLFLFGITAWTFWMLIQNKKKQQRLVIMKNEFIGNMTHELKTPISTVGVALEALSSFGESLNKEKQREYLDISQHELKRLSLLVDKVLKMASFDNDQDLLKHEKIDLNESINLILNSMKLHLEQKNAKVEYKCTISHPIIIGDSIHISNVFYNILDNAIKYSDENPIVQITLDETESMYLVGFKDYGQGIPHEYQDKIFDRFFRLPTNDHHNVKGHGLGLSYVKDIITKHDGTIELESAIGVGSKFIISLPKSQPNA